MKPHFATSGGDGYVSKDDLGESYDKKKNNRTIKTKKTSMSDFISIETKITG
jgi:hypothetical protein